MCIDADDTIIEVHGLQKQGSGYGYSDVRRLNALQATVTAPRSAPVIVAQRLAAERIGGGSARTLRTAVTLR